MLTCLCDFVGHDYEPCHWLEVCSSGKQLLPDDSSLWLREVFGAAP
jgi:hypothetical protein